MTIVSFQDIKFSEEEDNIRAHFLKNYYFDISREDLEDIGSFRLEDGALIFDEREKRVWNKFNLLLDKGLSQIIHKVRNKPCLYIHEHSGLPLIGTNEFGLVDRGSNIIEVKPLTGCNLSCTFCSVNEGVNNKTDILVEEQYLVEEFAKLAKLKKHPVEANIGPQGEPLLYPKIVELIHDLKEQGSSVVSINTNGTLLHPQFIDQLAQAGLDRINLSIHATNQEKANELMGGVQNIARLKEMIAYCAGKIDVLLAPVLIPGFNDDQLDGIIELSKTIQNKHWPSIGIQNFLVYPGGRNPGADERSWDDFYAILEQKEKEHSVDLTLKGNKNMFNIYDEESLPKPFRKGDVIKVELVAPGRNKKEFFAAAQQRSITVKNCYGKVGQSIKVKLLRDKHNIFTAIPV